MQARMCTYQYIHIYIYIYYGEPQVPPLQALKPKNDKNKLEICTLKLCVLNSQAQGVNLNTNLTGITANISSI